MVVCFLWLQQALVDLETMRKQESQQQRSAAAVKDKVTHSSLLIMVVSLYRLCQKTCQVLMFFYFLTVVE